MTRVRVLDNRDIQAVAEFLAVEPVSNIFVLSRIQRRGLNPYYLGCPLWGVERHGELVAICYPGTNVVPIGPDPDAMELFARKLGPRRRASSIMGRSQEVGMLFDELAHRGDQWRSYREYRAHQPMMMMDSDALVPADPRVRIMTPSDLEAYYPAAVAMYTEEVGVSPLDPTNSYRTYVSGLIAEQRAFGVIDAGTGKVIFKSDVGAATNTICQIQGVWLEPALRGQGLSAPAMAAVVNLARERWPIVSLYVNDFNVRAIRLYERVGFRQTAEFATVLY